MKESYVHLHWYNSEWNYYTVLSKGKHLQNCFYLLSTWYFCLVTPHLNKRSPLDNVMSLAGHIQNVQWMLQLCCTLTRNSWCLVCPERKRKASVTLTMCTTNTCLAERATTSLESRLRKTHVRVCPFCLHRLILVCITPLGVNSCITMAVHVMSCAVCVP